MIISEPYPVFSEGCLINPHSSIKTGFSALLADSEKMLLKHVLMVYIQTLIYQAWPN